MVGIKPDHKPNALPTVPGCLILYYIFYILKEEHKMWLNTKKLVLSSCSIYGTYKIQSRKVSWVCQFLLNDYTLRYQIWRLKIIKKITKYTWVKNRHSQFLSDKFKMKGRKGCRRLFYSNEKRKTVIKFSSQALFIYNEFFFRPQVDSFRILF